MKNRLPEQPRNPWIYVHQGLNRHQRRTLTATKGVQAADLAPMVQKPYCINKRKIKSSVRVVAEHMKANV